jgi:protein-tyrosine phosphatase
MSPQNNLPFPSPVKSLLFVCTGNCSRSVMAASVTRKLAPSFELDLTVESAGTDARAGQTPTQHTLQILKDNALEAPDHRAKPCSPELIQQSDLIFVMERYHYDHLVSKYPDSKQKIFLLVDFCPNLEAWIQKMGIPDPVGMNISFYENVYKIIDQSCREVLQILKKQSVS